jgi:hypothetical protein
MSHNIIDDIRESVKQAEQKRKEHEAKNKLQDEFAAFDFSKLRKMKDPELAAWQSKFPLDSPQYIIATQEWNNRSLSKQLKWVKLSAIVGPIVTLIAAILGIWAGAHWQENPQQKQQQPAIEQSYKTPGPPTADKVLKMGTEKKTESDKRQTKEK